MKKELSLAGCVPGADSSFCFYEHRKVNSHQILYYVHKFL